MNLYSPSGEKLLDNVDCNTEKSFKFTEYGAYTVEYITKDGGRSYSKKTYIQVIDEIAPKLNVEGGQDVTLSVGESLTIWNATCGDDETYANMYVFVYEGYECKPVSVGESVTFTKAGKYVVRYYVIDENYNETEITYTVTVK